jgi:hypothetical protein
MKYLLTNTLLIGSLLGCKKQSTLPETPQQLLVGTWHLVKFVEKQTSYGTLSRHDSTSYPLSASPHSITYYADGTSSVPGSSTTSFVPGSITSNYSYVPPRMTFTYSGVVVNTDFTTTVLQLTEHTLVTHTEQSPTTSTLEYWHTYER